MNGLAIQSRASKSSGPQTSVEGEEGGPMIRRHGTCMLTCMQQTAQYKIP